MLRKRAFVSLLAKEARFNTSNAYRGNPRGAEWHRWDLHVHTPASVESHFGDGQQDATWDKYIGALAALPPDIKAVGINDYFSIEGYRRVIEARQQGLLPNLELILPVVELRLTNFVGSADLNKLNFHVVFSDELSPDDIEQFFLRNLNIDLQLGGGPSWHGCVGTREGLLSLGKAVKTSTPDDVRSDHSELEVGFGSAALDLNLVHTTLRNSVFRDRFLTALGVGEWNQMRWVGAGGAQKRDVINRVNFSYTAAPTVAQYQARRKQLIEAEVNDRLIDASDAHYFADSAEPIRLGQTYTWIKADLTFQGLRRAIRRFNDRVFVGNLPPKLALVRARKTKYIDRIVVRKKEGSALSEAWFDADIPLSHDLVAVIGNQGSGKSALTDILALCGHTSVQGFSFLTDNKFRSERNKRAAEFVATLTWEDGSAPIELSLDQDPPLASVERVRYVPQGFFDSVTNETAVAEGGKFYTEVRKAIFSHVPTSDRLGCNSLEELAKRHTTTFDESLSEHRKELGELNRRIVVIEKDCAQSKTDGVAALIAQREREVATLEASPPTAVPEPTEQDHAALELETIRAKQESLRARIEETEASRGQLKQRRTMVHQALQSLRNEERRFNLAVQRIQTDLTQAGEAIDVASALKIAADYSGIQNHLGQIDAAIDEANAVLDSKQTASLVAQSAALVARRTTLEQESEAATNAYQSYLNAQGEWKARLAALTGALANPASDSLIGLKKRYEDLTVKGPAQLKALEQQRREKAKEIFDVVAQLAGVHEDIARNVRDHIDRQNLTGEGYRLAFDVRVGDTGMADRLFSCVGHQTGTFHGQQQGRDRLKRLLGVADFATSIGAVTFADTLLDHLKRDHKTPSLDPVDLARCLKGGATVEQVYNLVYGFEYLAPTFELGLNGKPLSLLSPGERGILLLVFYLVVDLGDEPLIIDQPEGNLNNQSIVKHLVPVFMAAKERRQIIIVTHNPNIAVVCDAEQIVSCEMDQDGSHRVRYRTGALENPTFNDLSLDLLEGTAAALDARVVTYDAMDARRDVVRLRVIDWDPAQPWSRG